MDFTPYYLKIEFIHLKCFNRFRIPCAIIKTAAGGKKQFRHNLNFQF